MFVHVGQSQILYLPIVFCGMFSYRSFQHLPFTMITKDGVESRLLRSLGHRVQQKKTVMKTWWIIVALLLEINSYSSVTGVTM